MDRDPKDTGNGSIMRDSNILSKAPNQIWKYSLKPSCSLKLKRKSLNTLLLSLGTNIKWFVTQICWRLLDLGNPMRNNIFEYISAIVGVLYKDFTYLQIITVKKKLLHCYQMNLYAFRMFYWRVHIKEPGSFTKRSKCLVSIVNEFTLFIALFATQISVSFSLFRGGRIGWPVVLFPLVISLSTIFFPSFTFAGIRLSFFISFVAEEDRETVRCER